MTGQEALFRFAGAVALVAAIFGVIMLVQLGGLAASVFQQLAQRRMDGRIGIVGEDYAPASLGQILGIDAFDHAVVAALGGALMPPAQLLEALGILRLTANDLAKLRCGHGWQQILAARAVDAVERQAFDSHNQGFPSL